MELFQIEEIETKLKSFFPQVFKRTPRHFEACSNLGHSSCKTAELFSFFTYATDNWIISKIL